jgi:two-component system NtrC family sensor kinase
VAATRIRGRLDELKQERNRARQAQAAAEDALQALRAAQAELLQMQQRAMASKLMASLAHQLNTPLGTCITAHSSQHDGLRGLALQMQSNALRRNELQEALHRSLGNAELMGTNLARLERLMKRFALFGAEHFLTQERLPCLVADAVHQAAGRFGLAHGQCFALSVPAVTLRCDAAALHGLLAELLDNALAARRPSDPPIAVSAVCDGERVTLQIADRGPGMSAAHMKRALNPYNTPDAKLNADDSAAGLGLGLGWPIVNHLAQHVLGAEIGLHASPDIGTCVSLQLPLKPD